MLEVDSNRIKIVLPAATRDSVGANLAKTFPKLNISEALKSTDTLQLPLRALSSDLVSPRKGIPEPSPRTTSSQHNEVHRNSNELTVRPSSIEPLESPRGLQTMYPTSPRPLPNAPNVPKVPIGVAAKLPTPPPLVMRVNSKNSAESNGPPPPPPRSTSPSPSQSPRLSTLPPQYPPPLPPNLNNPPSYAPPVPPPPLKAKK